MTWHYIVSRSQYNDIDHGIEYLYEIREYYEFADGKTAWTEDPIKPIGDSVEELGIVLTQMLNDLRSGEILDLTLDPPMLLKPGQEAVRA